MIASLNQSSSLSSLGAALMSATTSMAQPSREAAEQQGGVLLLIDAQTDSAPLEDVPFARDQIFNGFDPPARGRRTDFDIVEVKPELPRSGLCQRHGDGHRIVARYRFLDEADDVVVVDLRKAQIAGLQERRIVPPYPVEACDVVFDFFFSSRRRHTRWTGDWSSDVCSSDLTRAHQGRARARGRPDRRPGR